MIVPALLCAYVRCVVLCARCTPALQASPADALPAWKPWARVVLFTLVPVAARVPARREAPRSIFAPHADRRAMRYVRLALRRRVQQARMQ